MRHPSCREGREGGQGLGHPAWGNLLAKTITKCGAENLPVTADVQNRMHVTAGADYQYDAAGNMTYNAKDAQYYSFDQENRITGAGGYAYTYDGDGNRVEKSNGSTGTLYWYMSPGIVAESDLAGNLQSEYVFFAGERVARKDFPSLAVSYYFSDHLKTASVITDAAGNIKSESDYSRGAASCSLPRMTPTITNLPAKNGITKPGWIILGPGITRTAWADS